MIKASKENINKLRRLENEYFDLKGIRFSETNKSILEGKLVKGFVKSEDNVNEAIEKLTIKIDELKKQLKNENEKEAKIQEEIIKNSKEKGFAILRGSEKQIKWANDLRNKFINDINKMKEESKNDKDLKFLNMYFYNADIINVNVTFDLIEETLSNILKQKDEATFYIDNRFKKAIDVIITEIKKNNN
ncbi:MAG: hypothetical protein ACLR6T_08170 [Intestinibacter sp.]